MSKTRKTRYLIKCHGNVIGAFESYHCMELEAAQLLATASKFASEQGLTCIDKLKEQRGVACENLTLEAISGFDYDRVHGSKEHLIQAATDTIKLAVNRISGVLEYKMEPSDEREEIRVELEKIQEVLDGVI